MAKHKSERPPLPKPEPDSSLPSKLLIVIGAGGLLLSSLGGDLRLGMDGWPRSVFQALLWLAALFVLWSESKARSSQRTRVWALAILSVFALWSHLRLGDFHGQGRVLHHHELFNYGMGSKYQAELGHHGLYYATHRALVENDPAMHERIQVVKNLRSYQLESREISLQRSLAVANRFQPERWDRFRRDVAAFQRTIPPEAWQPLLVDHGYNASPLWGLLGRSVTADMDFDAGSLAWMGSFDPILLALSFALVAWAFGLQWMLLLAVFAFANVFATYDFTGGAFLRQLWFSALVAFLCLRHKQHWVLAGVALAIASMDRVFPAVLLALPIAGALAGWPGKGKDCRGREAGSLATLAAFAATVLVGVGLSSWAMGPQAWPDFLANARAHSSGYFLNQVSLRSLFLMDPVANWERLAEGWNEAEWIRERIEFEEHFAPVLLVLRLLASSLIALVLLRSKERRAQLALLLCVPFLLLYPANYYYALLALVALAWPAARGAATGFCLLQILLWLLRIALPPPLHVELLHWVASLLLLLGFTILLVAELSRLASEDRLLARASVGLACFGGLAFIAAIWIFPGDSGGDKVTLDLSLPDLEAVPGTEAQMESMIAWGNGWSLSDQVVFFGEKGPARGRLRLDAPEPGSYDLRVEYTTAPAFGRVRLVAPGLEATPAVDLFAPGLGKRSVLYSGLRLAKGSNTLELFVDGRHPKATAEHFAVDCLTLIPAQKGSPALPQAKRAEHARDAALAWLRAHPADDFDGGRSAVCSELVLLDHLLRHRPSAPDQRQAELLRRALWLEDSPGGWIEPDEGLALIQASIAAESRCSLSLVPRHREALLRHRDEAQAATPSRAFAMGSLLAHLEDAEATVAAPPALQQEYSSRITSALLSSPVDPARLPLLAASLDRIHLELLTLSVYGRRPLPELPALQDRAFWIDLLSGGLHWAREGGDPIMAARVLELTLMLGLDANVKGFDEGLSFLIGSQHGDGSFGDLRPAAPNPRRAGVLAVLRPLILVAGGSGEY